MTRGNNEPSSDLWDLILDMDWPRAIHHCLKCPQDANFLEGHWHETPLYLACQHNAPVEVIRAIIKAFPESVQIASRENRDLPIHISCRYQASAPILDALLEHYPNTVAKTTKCGKTPIMTLWDFRAREVKNHHDFWNKVLILLRAVARSDASNEGRFNCTCFGKVDKGKSNNFHVGNSRNSIPISRNQDQQILFVHAAASLGVQGCPIEILEFCVENFPKQVCQRDNSGHLPLHIAIHKRRRLEPKERSFLVYLLKAYPNGALERIYSDYDRYPLHSAVANGHTWSNGIQDIFLASPQLLVVRDPYTGLFPFQLAGIPINEKPCDTDNLETIYQLLRARPDVISYLQKIIERKNTWDSLPTRRKFVKRPSKRKPFKTYAKHFLGMFRKPINKNLIDFVGIAFAAYLCLNGPIAANLT